MVASPRKSCPAISRLDGPRAIRMRTWVSRGVRSGSAGLEPLTPARPYAKLDPSTRKDILAVIRALGTDPRPAGVKSLKGHRP